MYLVILGICATLASQSAAFFNPMSIVSSGYNLIKNGAYCKITECCNDYSIPANINLLESRLRNELFGQHIVLQQLLPALRAHLRPDSKSRKPLVISFNGTPGTGKNFVADQIAKALYTNGLKSRFVHVYLGRADFPLISEVPDYNQRIVREVRNAIANCPRSLFIFDEVDKVPPGTFQSLTSLLDYHEEYDGHDYTKAIFILISQSEGVHISDQLGKLMRGGLLREESQLSDFEQIIEKAAYNLLGGMRGSALIEAHVVDHYIPFLPLEKAHAIKCLEAEYNRWGKDPRRNEIERILQTDITYDPVHVHFVSSGCKTLGKKVAVDVLRESKNEF